VIDSTNTEIISVWSCAYFSPAMFNLLFL